MIERLLIALAVLALGLIVYRLFTQHQRRRATALAATRDPVLAHVPPGKPTIVYFTTPACVACRVVQAPALARLQALMHDEVAVVRVDASAQPDAAARWGVLTAPTTFVLAADGCAAAVNYGAVDEHILMRQLGGPEPAAQQEEAA